MNEILNITIKPVRGRYVVATIQNQGWNELNVQKIEVGKEIQKKNVKIIYIIKTVRGRYGFATIKNHRFNKLNVKNEVGEETEVKQKNYQNFKHECQNFGK